MMNRRIAFRVVSALGLAAAVSCWAQPRVEFIDQPNRIDVLVGGNLLTSYRYEASLPKPVLYPVRTLTGVTVNRGYPLQNVPGEVRDHPHHIGLFFTYDEVNKVHFWGNTSTPPRIKHIETKEKQGGPGHGRLSTVMQWLDMQNQPLLREERTMTLTVKEREYWLDFDIHLTALDKPVEFGDTKEGMFALRVAEWLKEDKPGTGHYLSSEGTGGESKIWGKRARWVALEGEKDGNKIGVAMFNHPTSVNYPTFWHARAYGLFAANPLGQSAFERSLRVPDAKPLNLTLQPGQSAKFAFRVMIYEGSRTPAEFENVFSDYTKQTLSATTSSVVEPGAKLENLASTFSFTEGASTDKEGNVYFTDQPNDKIYKWSVDGKLSVFLDKSERSNGMYFDKDGNLISCADLHNRLVSINPAGDMTVLVDKFENKLLNGPNDVWVQRETGAMYFTDPFYRRDYWDRGPMEQNGQHVYYLSPDRKTVARVITDLVQPNGIVGTPDGKMLYVSDIGGRKTYSYTIQPDGMLADKKLFCNMGSDGMTLDNVGNVYLTGQGVTVFDLTGKKIDHIDVPAGWTANLCFGGRDRHTLFITAQKSFFSIRMRTSGVE